MTNRKIDIHKSHQIDLPSLKTLLISSFFGLVLGFLGPFGSFNMPLMQRLVYWMAIFNLGYLIYYISHQITDWAFKNKDPSPVIKFIAPTLLASVPLSVIVGIFTQSLYDIEIGLLSLTLRFLPQVLILGLAIDSIMRLIYKNQSQDNLSTTLTSAEKPGLAFLNRLPIQLGEDLICCVMEDHYLIAHTEKGNHMLLLRMKDALVELKDYNGIQVHRSSWVAINKVQRVKKVSRKTILHMSNGLEISVSKNYLSAIKEARLM